MRIDHTDAAALLPILERLDAPNNRYLPRLRETVQRLANKHPPASINLDAPARAGELGVIAGLRRIFPDDLPPRVLEISQQAGDEITRENVKPRCPTCGAVGRRLRRYVGNNPVPQPVDDAAECPEHGTFLLLA